MILWTIKLISSVRKAIAGRRHPAQLAWGVALGCLLGLIPHGNLLAIALVFVVLSLRVNHAMVALSAVLVTLVAPKMDPMFHEVGTWFFGHESVAERMAWAWQLPLIPWTDLNNTVVMGSFLIGLVALVPLFLLTYPMFKNWALAIENSSSDLFDEMDRATAKVARSRPVEEPTGKTIQRIDPRHETATAPHKLPSPAPQPAPTATSGRVYDVRRVDSPEPVAAPKLDAPPEQTKPKTTKVAIEQAAPKAAEQATKSVESRPGTADDQEKIDEALSYLLRQLRDSKEKDAA